MPALRAPEAESANSVPASVPLDVHVEALSVVKPDTRTSWTVVVTDGVE
jgi:hypothetical protein